MIVRKVRGQNKVGKIIISQSEYMLAKRLGIPIEIFVNELLALIAKQRKWKWFFKKDRNK